MPGFISTSSNWSKSNTVTTSSRNWGLYRSWLRYNPSASWGFNGTYTEQTGTVTLNASGLGVDIVILDTGPVDSNHPEFAVNSDGTGGSRVQYFNWFSLASNVGDTANVGGTYNPSISPITSRKNHANHVAGIAAGNTQGWAPNAHIYSISLDVISNLKAFEYIRAWHNQKGTGRPTIVNCSFISEYVVKNISDINSVTYRGVTTSGPFTAASLANYGIFPEFNDTAFGSTTTQVLLYNINSNIDADIEQCFNDGIIIVASAMNNNMKIAVDSSDIDWDNKLNINNAFFGTTDYFYNRGASPTDSGNVITVGSVRAGADSPAYADGKANNSNRGPGVEIFAPGAFITSAWLDNSLSSFGITPIQDPRNPSYYLQKLSGTSMAAPQVTGLLACMLELNPTLNQTSALAALISASQTNQINDTKGGVTDYYDLLGSPNRYLAVPTNLLPAGYVNYSINSVGSSVSEGASIAFVVTTTGVPDGTELWWAAFSDTGASSADITSPAPPMGSIIISSSGPSTIIITIATDVFSPEVESFYIRLYPSQADRDLFGPGLTYSNTVTIVDVPPGAVQVWPKNYGTRPATGQVYPRHRS